MKKENILIVAMDFHKRESWALEDIAEELVQLVVSCGGEVVERMICSVPKPTARYLLGEGKVKDIAEICSRQPIDVVIFSHELKGSQQRNLEEVIGVKTIDRTQLILDIFARHATSREGRVQVELAQLEYLRPRLVGRGVELSRLGGGIGTLGPGETKLEVDRRRIAQRISKLKNELKDITANRIVKRNKRKGQKIPEVAFVGYTNAGKSTLLNALTDAHQKTQNSLFTTLDPLTRQYILPNSQKIVLSDTVGFMYELPHHLIESFRATLEEVVNADLLLHVLDVSHPRFRYLNDAVISVLRELDAHNKPMITVLNKIDKLDDKSYLRSIQANFEHSVCLSALTGENKRELDEKIMEQLFSLLTEIDIKIPLHRMDLVNLVHKEGQVDSIEYSSDSVRIQAMVPRSIEGKFRDFAKERDIK